MSQQPLLVAGDAIIGASVDELPQEIGARLGWSDRQTTDRLSEAVDAIRCTPAMFELTASGSLDARKINIRRRHLVRGEFEGSPGGRGRVARSDRGCARRQPCR